MASPSGDRRHVLVMGLDGAHVGDVFRARSGKLTFVYSDEWIAQEGSFAVSYSMPQSISTHEHGVVSAFLSGLLPDDPRTLKAYAQRFGVSSQNPVALLAEIGDDCAGAIQLAAPADAEKILGTRRNEGGVKWLTEDEVAEELRNVKKTGIPGPMFSDIGKFSLAGAQPKLALLERDGRWGIPHGRTPSNRILKPPSLNLAGLAENEHYCLAIAAALDLGAVKSQVRTFSGESAIVVERFDRVFEEGQWKRLHQEDFCQALSVEPTRKYENEGGPGLESIIDVLQSSRKAKEDIDRLLGATVLNWVLAATDEHAKNYAILHNAQGIRLAPFYDIISYLPYADEALNRVKLAMRIGGEYLVRRIVRKHWTALARKAGLREQSVIDNVERVLDAIPQAAGTAADQAIEQGLDASTIEDLRARILKRVDRCKDVMKKV